MTAATDKLPRRQAKTRATAPKSVVQVEPEATSVEAELAKYEYTPIEPVAIHFRECGDRVVEGIAIAQNGLGSQELFNEDASGASSS